MINSNIFRQNTILRKNTKISIKIISLYLSIFIQNNNVIKIFASLFQNVKKIITIYI